MSLSEICYLDPGFFELEQERVLRPGWHVIGRVHDLPSPGDYRALDVFGEPVLLVRGEDHRLRALSGVCRHRAFRMAAADGNAKRITCPYHRWSYALDGSLAAAPLMDEVPGFDRSRCRLPEFGLAEWQGFVFVSTDADAHFDASQLGPMDARLDGIGLSDFVEVGTLDFDSPFNWKVLVDNFMESYHHLGPHSKTLQPRIPARGTHVEDLPGPFSVLENPALDGDGSLWVIHVFPTLLFAVIRGEAPTAVWYEMSIGAPDRFDLRVHLLAPPAHADDATLAGFFAESVRAIHLEDVSVCEGIQAGLASRHWEPGPLARASRRDSRAATGSPGHSPPTKRPCAASSAGWRNASPPSRRRRPASTCRSAGGRAARTPSEAHISQVSMVVTRCSKMSLRFEIGIS
jgi:nitrite reductase/ring-hydroxylating ferredoxin subunit